MKRIFLLLLLACATVFQFSDFKTAIQTDQQSEALRALDFWTAQRAYPNRMFPDNAYYAAYEKDKKNLSKRKMFNPDNEAWRLLGPYNQGGRTIALAVDPQNPNVVYAGAASGGLWRLTFQGNQYSWQYIDTGFPVLGVNAIAIDPTNSNIIYIGTGEVYGYQNSIGGVYIRTTRGSYGIGLLKSEDGGATWTKSLDWSQHQERGVLSIEINPQNPKTVFAGTSEGVYKTSDGGKTWELVHDIIMAVDVAINPADTNIVYASCGNLGSYGTGIYRSKQAGKPGSWEKLRNGLPVSWGGKALLDICKSKPNIVYASIGNGYQSNAGTWLCKTTDYGDTWTIVSQKDYSTYQGWFAHYVRVHPEDENKLMCAGVNFYMTTDGGSYFFRRSGMHVDHHAFANHPTNPNIVYFGNDGGVYRTTDGGYTFQNLNYGYVTTQFYNGFSSSVTDPNLAMGGLQDNSTVIYTGEDEWTTGLIGGDGGYTAIRPDNNNILYGSWQYLNIVRSNDRGLNWQKISSSLKGSDVAFIAPYVICPSKPWVMYAGTNIMYRSDDSGTSWKSLNNGLPLNGNAILSIAVAPNNEDVIYAATVPKSTKRAEIFRSRDGGLHWDSITGTLPDRYYMDIQVSPTNPDHVYVVVSGFGTSHLYSSKNGGDTWTDIGSGLPDVPTSALAIDPEAPQILYVGNDLGVYVSPDDGASWYRLKEGLPTAVLVMDLSISPGNRKIRAATHGNGVFERSLLDPATVSVKENETVAGDYWLSQNYPNPFNPSTKITFHLPKPEFVTLTIFNSVGQRVRTLAANGYSAGIHSVQWHGKDDFGRNLPSGSYIVRLKAGNIIKSRKMLLMR